MFVWWGRCIYRARWWVLILSIATMVAGGWWGMGIFGSLSSGGYDVPGSPSSRAHELIAERIGSLGGGLQVIYTSPSATVDQPGLAVPVQTVVAALRQRPEVVSVSSFYDTGMPQMISHDRHATYLSIQLRPGEENQQLADLAAIRPILTAGGDVQTEVGGMLTFLHDANRQIKSDILRAEIISLPIVFLLMLVIFGGLVAAATPLVVAGMAILGGFVIVRLLAMMTEVSVFAANVITMLGLGMAIDYALFVVSRFREQMAAGQDTRRAIITTIATAGRTVAVSALIVAFALSSLLLFPMGFLKSMAYGGMAAVLVAMLAALTVLPALLAVLGPRINALRLPGWRRRRGAAGAEGVWARIARSVMRRPIPYALAVSAVLLALAAPFLRAELGGFDERVLPEGTPSRTVAERLAAEFPGGGASPILAVVTGASPQAAQAFAAQVGAVPGITGVQVLPGGAGDYLVQASYEGEPTSRHARDLVQAVRAVPAPAGAEVLVGGRSASNLDQVESLSSRLGWMVLYVFIAIFMLLFVAFGSVVVPLKAFLMNLISIGAAFGVVVWIFQDGHFADILGFTATGVLEPTDLILMLAILFGLSTDYEVFLLSRVREEWDRSGDNTEAVSSGLQRTGGIITAAALLLIVVVSGFATGGTSLIKMLGIGTVVAIAVDATLVRVLLVPATMRLLGRWNWWAPRLLARGRRRLRQAGSAPVRSV